MIRGTGRILGLGLAMALLLGCGHKSPPIVPQPKIPGQPTDLRVDTGCGALQLSFLPPTRDADGAPVRRLIGFVVERKRGPLGGDIPVQPLADAEPGTPTPTATPIPPDVTPVIPLAPESDFLRIAILEFDPTPTATPWITAPEEADPTDEAEAEEPELPRIELRDTGGYSESVGWDRPEELLDGYGYTYRVAAMGRRGRLGLYSAPVAVLYEVPPAAPTGLTARVEERTVILVWRPVEKTCTDREAVELEGYRIYRSIDPTEPAQVSLNPNPVIQPEYRDQGVESDQTYYYQVKAVRKGDRTLSAPSAELAVLTRDVFPPARPTGLMAVPSSRGVHLVWNSNSETDLDHYVVYRRRLPGAGWERVTPDPVPGSAFTDAGVRSRIRYEYAITAVDGSTAANESERSETVTVRAQ